MQKFSKKIILEFVILAAVLCAIGYLIHCQFSDRLHKAVDESVLRHINTVSYSVEHALNRNLREMHVIARTIEEGKLQVENFVSISRAFRENTYKSGILRPNGKLLSQTDDFLDLTWEEFLSIQEVFNGEDVVAYGEEKGIIFAVPVHINGENCAMYQQFSKEGTKQLFSVVSYDGQGRVTLADGKGNWTPISVTSPQNDKIYNELYISENFSADFHEKITDRKKLLTAFSRAKTSLQNLTTKGRALLDSAKKFITIN